MFAAMNHGLVDFRLPRFLWEYRLCCSCFCHTQIPGKLYVKKVKERQTPDSGLPEDNREPDLVFRHRERVVGESLFIDYCCIIHLRGFRKTCHWYVV